MDVETSRALATTEPTSFPLSRAQTEIWFGQILDPESANYNIGRYIEIFGHINPGLFGKALQKAVNDIDTLRLIFDNAGDELRQYFHSCTNYRMPFIDVS